MLTKAAKKLLSLTRVDGNSHASQASADKTTLAKASTTVTGKMERDMEKVS